jgi:hypothetical protein
MAGRSQYPVAAFIIQARIVMQYEVELEVNVSLTQRDWRVLLHAAERECHYLARRSRRLTSKPGGHDARMLERLRRILPVLGRAAGEEPRFV